MSASPSISAPSKQPGADKLKVPRRLVKLLAIVVGGGVSLLCLMSLVAKITSSVWAQLAVSAIVLIGIPAFLADRVLPGDGAKRSGLVSDVFALFYMLLGVGFAVGGHRVTKGWLAAEGDLLAASPLSPVAPLAYLLARVEPTAAPTPEPQPDLSASASAQSAPTVESAPTATHSAVTTAAPASSTANAKPTRLSAADIFKAWAPSVVSVSVEKGEGNVGGGTGFLVDSKGTIVTNHHVIKGATKGSIKFINGATFAEVTVLLADESADLAILRVDLDKPTSGERPKVTPVKLADSDGVTVGENAVSIGNPLGLEHTLTTGVVSSRRKMKGKRWIQMSTPVSPGNSGGPVFNEQGLVIGVTTLASFGAAQNLNFAVPINVAKALLKGPFEKTNKLGAPTTKGSW